MGKNERPNIYDYEKQLEYLLAKAGKIEKSGHTQEIIAFERYLVNMGIAIPTRIKHLHVLLAFSKAMDKPFREATKEDLETVVYSIRTNPRYGPWTVHKHLVCIKRFYKWVNGGEKYPDCVRWIKSNVKDRDTKLPESLITQEEVKHMLQACDNHRDRCLLSMLNELGCRVGELLTIRIGSLEENGDHYRVNIQYSKTKPRRLKLLDSRPYVAKWLNTYPNKTPDSPLFIGIGSTNKGKPLNYGACRMLIKRIAERAGVTKAVNPHNWRHSTATRYANFLTYSQLCHWFGWAHGSRIPGIYIHLSGQDIDSALDAMRGKTPTKKLETTLTGKQCPVCRTENEGMNDLCERCGHALNLKVIINREEEEKRFREEILFRQKALEEYIKFQNEKTQKSQGQ